MTLGQRIDERRKAMGISQAELARRVGMRQSTLNSLINGSSRSSRKIVELAQHLETSPAFLTGKTDDPDKEAPAPAPRPLAQFVMMPTALPSEDALTAMYEGQLAALRRLDGAELARALAKRLPKALSRLQGLELFVETADDAVEQEDPGHQPIDHPARQQARRT